MKRHDLFQIAALQLFAVLPWCFAAIGCQSGEIGPSSPRGDSGQDDASRNTPGSGGASAQGGGGNVPADDSGVPWTGQGGTERDASVGGNDSGLTGGNRGTGGSGGAGGNKGTGGAIGTGGRSGTGGGTAGTGGSTAGAGGRAGTGGSSIPADGSTATLVNPRPGSKFFLGVNFWNIDWEGQDNYFANGVDFSNTTNPWKPELLADLAPFHVIRFMDWNLTSGNDLQSNWSTRKKKTDPQTEPVAFEWQIDLCNRAKIDYWVTIPHQATPDYWTKLAQLIHDQLDPSLRVYVEWSNEVWNASPNYPAHDYSVAQASTLNLPGGEPAASYYVYVSVRAFEAFEAVFGKGSPRVVKVIAGQAAWTHWCEEHTTALANSTINPNGIKPDVYAVAPYLAGSSIQELQGELPTISQWVKDHVACAQKAGLPLISYEGGADSFALGNGCATLQKDPGQYEIYRSFLDEVSEAGMTGPFMHYTHTGDCWGLKQKTGDPLTSAPRYRGVVDWLAAHP